VSFEDRIQLPITNIIHRRIRLLDKLTEFVNTDKRLITITAPGGYGKSILLADFSQTADWPVCWCSLDYPDQDPISFLTLLAHSIAHRFFYIETDTLLEILQQGDTQTAIHHIGELLMTAGPHIIILDDYHKATSAGTTLALNRLLRRLLPHSHIIIATRGNLGLETGQVLDLVITERMTGLTEDDLRFTSEELQRVMLKRFGRRIETDTAQNLARITDGNIAQILLTGHITHAGHILKKLQTHTAEERELIYNYLATEVFDKQPPELQKFMLYSAMLPDIRVEWCNELLETSQAQTFLDRLVQKDLFITQTGTGIKYHDLYADFLRGKLAEAPSLFQQVTARAAQVLMSHARFEAAINLYISLQAWEQVIEILEEKGYVFYNTGRALTVSAWLEQLSGEKLTSHPRLLLLRGQILNNDQGELQEAQEAFRQAEQNFQRQTNHVGAAEAQVWRGINLRMMGQATAGLNMISRGLAQLEKYRAKAPVIAWAIENRGKAYSSAGNTEAAITDLRRAMEMFQTLDNSYRVGNCHHDLGVCLEKQGKISGAEHHYNQAMQIWEQIGNANSLSNTLNSLGVCSLLQGNHEQAMQHFRESMEIGENIGDNRRIAYALAGIAETHLASRQYTEAIQSFDVSTSYARVVGSKALEIYNQIKQAEVYYHQGNMTQALSQTKQAKEIAGEIGLKMEYGQVCALQAKIYVSQGQFKTAFDLFATALDYLADNDLLEQTKLHLWWGYGLLLTARPTMALDQLEKAINLGLSLGELSRGLKNTIAETHPLLHHFLFRSDVPPALAEGIRFLLKQGPSQLNISDPYLHIFAFGNPTLITGEQRRQFMSRGKTHKLPEFLLYMAIEGRQGGVRRNEIAAVFWPDQSEKQAARLFHQHLRRLRNNMMVHDDVIVVDNDYYQVSPQYLIWCDALAFSALYSQAATASAEKALSLYQEIIALYQDEFLAGFELSEWGNFHRNRYEIQFLQVVNLAAEQLLAQNYPHEALDVIQKGLYQDYFQEGLHRLAFQSYANLGLYDQLTEYYSEITHTFNAELGAPPTNATRNFYQQLLKHKEK